MVVGNRTTSVGLENGGEYLCWVRKQNNLKKKKKLNGGATDIT